MKYSILILLFATIIVFQPGCKNVIDDVIDCSIESAFLSIHADVDSTNSKLVHFEFVNSDTDGGFSLDSDIGWDFGDGNTSTSINHKTEHIYAESGDYKVKATYILRRGDATCSGPKEKDVVIN
jgi:hypothetical protein